MIDWKHLTLHLSHSQTFCSCMQSNKCKWMSNKNDEQNKQQSNSTNLINKENKKKWFKI